MKQEELIFGSLAVCTDAKAAASSGTSPVAGIVGIMVEPRKRDARILYVEPCRSHWLPRSAIRPASLSETESHPLKLVADLVAWLRGRGLEVESSPGGSLRVSIHHGAITPDRIDVIREKIGERLLAWRLRPAGLSKIQSVFEIQAPASNKS
jgi:hypothetical protein